MAVIGVTGKSGSGKSSFASLLAQKLNGVYVNMDKVCHQALLDPSIFHTLCTKFGTEILGSDGQIDRKKLGNIAFTHPANMQVVTDLTYDYMDKQLDSLLKQAHTSIVLDAILLPQTHYWDKCDSKILVLADDIKRKQMVIKRDHISEEYFDKREKRSIDYSPFHFDYMFFNDYTPEAMKHMLSTFGNLKRRIKKDEIKDTGNPISL